MNEIIVNKKEQLSWLEALNYNELKPWVISLIKDKFSEPLDVDFDNTEIDIFLVKFYTKSKNRTFQCNIERIILYMFNKWIVADGYTILFYLSSLVGQLKIYEAGKKIIVLLKSNKLKSVIVNDQDMHFFLLRVLGGLNYSDDLETILNRDYDDPKYLPILFKILLWNKEYKDAINLLNKLFIIHENNSEYIDLKYSIKEFVSLYGKENFYLQFTNIFSSIEERFIELFIKILNEIKIELRNKISQDNTLLLVWNCGDTINSYKLIVLKGNSDLYINIISVLEKIEYIKQTKTNLQIINSPYNFIKSSLEKFRVKKRVVAIDTNYFNDIP